MILVFPGQGNEGMVATPIMPSEQPDVRIVYFENTGHLIRRVAFEQYMSLVREYLKAH